jgi:hypothetical protein
MNRGSRLDELLTLLFMVLAVIAVVCYFFVDSRLVFMIIGGIAVVMRIVQYIMRIFP